MWACRAGGGRWEARGVPVGMGGELGQGWRWGWGAAVRWRERQSGGGTQPWVRLTHNWPTSKVNWVSGWLAGPSNELNTTEVFAARCTVPPSLKSSRTAEALPVRTSPCAGTLWPSLADRKLADALSRTSTM